MTAHPRATVGRALADALLGAGAWDRPGLVDAAAEVVGSRQRWLWSLAAEVLAAHPRPPADRGRELAALVVGCGALERAWSRAVERGEPLRVHHHPVVAARTVRRPWPVPRLDGVDELAALLGLELGELEWFADVQHRQRRARPGPLHHHRHRWVERPGRTPRLLEAPLPRLRALQRVLLHEVLAAVPVHPAAHGCVPGRSAVTGAAAHVGRDVVIGLDLTSFFPAVTAGRVHGVMRTAGWPEAVAHVLTGLVTHATPVAVLAAMPPGGTGEERFALRRRLAGPHLPQGAPTSPHLANLAAHRLDRRIAGWAEGAGATYTRYVDDLTLSGGVDLRRRADAVVAAITRIAAEEGYPVNPRKTRVRGASTSQRVTGVVVNDRTSTPRREHDRLRAVLHQAVLHGPRPEDVARHGGAEGYRAHLLGRIGWTAAVHPDRAARLCAQLDRVTW